MTLFIVLSSLFVYFIIGAITMGITEELWHWSFDSWEKSPEKLGWYIAWPIVLFFVGLGSLGEGAGHLARQAVKRIRRR